MANFQSVIDKLCQSYAGNNGKMLLHMGALGWVLSSASHILMIAKSPTIGKEKKKFLLPQEILDGVVNVGLYYTLTDFAKKGVDWIAENRRMPQSTIDAIKGYTGIADNAQLGAQLKTYAADFAQGGKEKLFTRLIKKTPLKNLSGKGVFAKMDEMGASGFYKKAIDEMVGSAGLTKNNVFETINQAQSNCGGDFKAAIESLKNSKALPEKLLDVIEAQRDFRTFKNGVGTAASIIASVLTVSIITPIVRNKLTNRILKQKHEAPEDKKVFYNSARPMPLVFKSFSSNIKI